MPIPINMGQFVASYVQGQDSANQVRTVKALTARINNYAAAYVAKFPDATSFAVVPKLTPAPGMTTIVTVTLNGQDASGNPLPPLSQDYEIKGPPAAPLATSLSISGTSNVAIASAPPDPGSDSVALLP